MSKDTMSLTEWAAKQAAQCKGAIKYYISEGIPKDEIRKEFKTIKGKEKQNEI